MTETLLGLPENRIPIKENGVAVDVPEESRESREHLAELIEEGDPSYTLQEALDKVFSPERQAELVATASVDCEGRKVRYYRYISREKLCTLLEKGELTALDYYDSEYSDQDNESLHIFLARYMRDSFPEGKKYSDFSLEDLLLMSFGEVADAEVIHEIFLNTETRNWPAILEFVRVNVDPLFVRRSHSGGSYSGQKFSDYLSISVGGPMRSSFSEDVLYLEMVFPDEQVVPYPEVHITGERELFVKNIRVEQVSRVYGNGYQMRKDLIQDPTTAPGSYYVDHKPSRFTPEHFEHWRWEVPIKETVPARFKPLYDKQEQINRIEEMKRQLRLKLRKKREQSEVTE